MVVFALGVVGYGLYRPGDATDLIFYAATVHQWDGLDPAAIQEAAFADAREHFAPDVYEQLVHQNEYMETVAADPEALVQQIPFYSVKALFPALLIAFRSVGIPIGTAALLISLISYLALTLLVFAWLRRHLQPWPAFGVTALIALSSPWWSLARLQTPDALGLLLGIAALFLLLELRKTTLAFVTMLLAIAVRPNMVIMLAAVLLALVVLAPSQPLHLSWRRAAAWTLAGAGLAAALIIASGNYGTGTLFYHSLVEYLPYPAAGPPPLSLLEVLRIYAFEVANIGLSPIPLFIVIGVLGLRLRATSSGSLRADAPGMMIVAMLVTIVGVFASYPNEPERILAMPFLACTLILAYSVFGTTSAGSGEALEEGPSR